MREWISLVSAMIINFVLLIGFMLFLVAVEGVLRGHDWLFVFKEFIPTIINF